MPTPPSFNEDLRPVWGEFSMDSPWLRGCPGSEEARVTQLMALTLY
jgi:hypothetical protein